MYSLKCAVYLSQLKIIKHTNARSQNKILKGLINYIVSRKDNYCE